MKNQNFLKYTLISLVYLNLLSCSVKKEEDVAISSTVSGNSPIGTDRESDYDGDMVKDYDEIKMGRSPVVADIPNVRVRFLQNYKITIKFKDIASEEIGEFIVDTNTMKDDPDFKYRVGETVIRNKSFVNASSVGKFSSHSTGEINSREYSWVSFPDVDIRFYLDNLLKYKKYFNTDRYEILNISLDVENSIRLKENDGFGSIKDVTVNFYYYDYEKESYVTISSSKIERHFNAGVNEVFNIHIDNIPSNLIVENYFKKGEFILSELHDYDIPNMETTYKKLMASIKTKTVPVVFNTPSESNVSFVGVSEEKNKFTDIMEALFGNNFKIENNEVTRIGQFENNLPDYTYLQELRNFDKKGKWYVFTSNLPKGYLDHGFNVSDAISISYVTGKTLSEQSSEKVFSYRENAKTSDGTTIYPLGNVSPNSVISMQMKPNVTWGEKKTSWGGVLSPSSCKGDGNCIKYDYSCFIQTNTFTEINSEFSFSRDFDNEIQRMFLIINNDEFSLRDLIKEKKVIVNWVGENLHLSIENIREIKELNEYDDNIVALKLMTFTENVFNGAKLAQKTGRDSFICDEQIINFAFLNKLPLSTDSVDFDSWSRWVNWGLIQRGDAKTYTQDFSIGLSAIVQNNFN